MKLVFLVLACCVAISEQLSAVCRSDEVYKKCGCVKSCCNYRNKLACSGECLSGCFCRDGLVKDSYGKCINPEKCPGNPTCKKDEQYYDHKPDCKNTCEAYNNPGIRCRAGDPGCFCREGMVKRKKDGKCVLPEDCDNETCGRNEIYTDCVNPCNDCASRGVTCNFLVCNKGCDCKPGYRRDSRKNCIPESQCPTKNGTCGRNEVYKECGSCEATCSNRKPFCTQECKTGCYCKEGYIRKQEKGGCIPINRCPPDFCGRNEVYKECGSCQATCSNRNPLCTKECKTGCYCKAGYIREQEDSSCIRINQCPPAIQCDIPLCREGCYINYNTKPCPSCECDQITCGPNSKLSDCASRCPRTCSNRSPICTKECVTGCVCDEGFIKDDYGNCIPEDQCPTGDNCGLNEEYLSCGSACPPSCNKKPEVCIQVCREGCFCKKGFIRERDATGARCIPENQCPAAIQCSPPKCGHRCWINYETKPCPSCECDEDTPRFCASNEEYRACGTACQATCNNKNPVCTKQCKSGCFCKKGFIRKNEKDLTCIPEKQCSKGTICHLPKCGVGCRIVNTGKECPVCVCDGNNNGCGLNEEYSSCVNPCNNCQIKGKCNFLVCNKGCDCIKDYYRNEQGECIPEKKCPNENTCGPNEEFSECGTACPPTCTDKPEVCTFQCVRGCFCKKGFVLLAKDGPCVPESSCPPGIGVCKRRGEVLKSCGSPCEATCANRRFRIGIKCPYPCKRGCYCRDGLVRDSYKNCVKPSQCGNGIQCSPPKCKPGCWIDYTTKPCPRCLCNQAKPNCGKNEMIVDCVKPKWCNSCGIRGNCKLASKSCKRGCDCKDNYYRNEDGVCIPESQCPKTCGRNEEYSLCGTMCQPTCTYKPIACSTVCIEGCFCKKGFIREKEGGGCISKSLCKPDDNCPLINCLSGRGCYLDNSANPCPKCVCDNNNNGTEICYKSGEVYKECGSPCVATCANRNIHIGIPCQKPCQPGCFCEAGLVRDSKNNCVNPNQCENGSCGSNEVYSTCGTSCQATCDNKNPFCVEQCQSGCFCNPGFIRKHDNGPCIPNDQCPTENTCGPDEEMYDCIPFCKNRCNPRKICPRICKRGCYCRKGLVQNDDGKCVRKDQCNKPNNQICKENEQYYTCKPTCNNTCENYNSKNQICPLYCVGGCSCKKGFVLNKDGKCVRPEECFRIPLCPREECPPRCHLEYGGRCPSCVCPENSTSPGFPLCPREECPPRCHLEYGGRCPSCVCPENSTNPGYTCGPDEQWYPCKPFCVNRCNPPKVCPRICIKGCFCKEGLRLNDDNKCVRKEQCNMNNPNNQTCTKENEQFYTCRPTCNNTCENYGKKGPCPLICGSGCACKKGYVLRNGVDCVRPEECKVPVCPRIACSPPCQFENRGPCPECICPQQNSTFPGVPVCPRIACPSFCHFEKHGRCNRCVCPKSSPNSEDTSESSETSYESSVNSETSSTYRNNEESEMYEYNQRGQDSSQTRREVNSNDYEQNNYGFNDEDDDDTDDTVEDDSELQVNKEVGNYYSQESSGDETKSNDEVMKSYNNNGDKTKYDQDTYDQLEKSFEDYETYSSSSTEKRQQSSESDTSYSYEEDYGYNSEGNGSENYSEKNSTITCGPNSKLSDCASRCPRTCSDRSPTCTQVCVTGCVCDEGYIQDDNGNCIPEDQCPTGAFPDDDSADSDDSD